MESTRAAASILDREGENGGAEVATLHTLSTVKVTKGANSGYLGVTNGLLEHAPSRPLVERKQGLRGKTERSMSGQCMRARTGLQ